MSSTATEAASTAEVSDSPVSGVSLNVLFYGGLDLVFDGKHELRVTLKASSSPTTVGDLITELAANFALPHKRELFSRGGTSVTPGILVLINEADWELEGGETAELGSGDEVVFVSTLHGG